MPHTSQPQEIQPWLAALSQAWKLPALGLNRENRCALTFDRDHRLSLEYQPQKKAFLLSAYLGSLPSSPSTEIYERLLQANFFWNHTAGATLSMDPQQKRLVLAEIFLLHNHYEEDFVQKVKTFVQMIAFWKKEIQTWGQRVEETPSPSLPLELKA